MTTDLWMLLAAAGLFYIAQVHVCGVPIASADVDELQIDLKRTMVTVEEKKQATDELLKEMGISRAAAEKEKEAGRRRLARSPARPCICPVSSRTNLVDVLLWCRLGLHIRSLARGRATRCPTMTFL